MRSQHLIPATSIIARHTPGRYSHPRSHTGDCRYLAGGRERLNSGDDAKRVPRGVGVDPQRLRRGSAGSQSTRRSWAPWICRCAGGPASAGYPGRGLHAEAVLVGKRPAALQRHPRHHRRRRRPGPGAAHTPFGGKFELDFRAAVVTTVYGGASEILREIIAERRRPAPQPAWPLTGRLERSALDRG